jgi:hypothetical protein
MDSAKSSIQSVAIAVLSALAACTPSKDPQASLRKALSFYASFDNGVNADFDRGDPRRFRMGAFPDKMIWNPENRKPSEIPNSEKPLIPVDHPPFSRDRWTHIVITIEGFNNPGKEAMAMLYLNGRLQSSLDGWEQKYTWDVDSAQIRLGVNFVGDFDELSCFDRALTPDEIVSLYSLSEGVGSL